MKWVKWFMYGIAFSLVASVIIWLVNSAWAYTASEPLPHPSKILTGSIGLFLLYILFGVYGVVKHLIKAKR